VKLDSGYNFESFAETAEYHRVNKKIIANWISLMTKAGVKRIGRILDVATGIGTMVQLFLHELPDDLGRPDVLCLDKSKGALKVANRKLKTMVNSFNTIHSPVQSMEVLNDRFSIVLWGNGIHNLSGSDQREAVIRIGKALEPGGWFFFNSAFYKESRPKDTMSFYRYQVKCAVKILRDKGVSRERNNSRAEAAEYRSKQYYSNLVQKAGLRLQDMEEVSAPLYRQAWEYISGFRNYARGALHGYPVGEAQQALTSAVAPALEKYGEKDEEGNLYIPRRWLTIAARLGD